MRGGAGRPEYVPEDTDLTMTAPVFNMYILYIFNLSCIIGTHDLRTVFWIDQTVWDKIPP